MFVFPYFPLFQRDPKTPSCLCQSNPLSSCNWAILQGCNLRNVLLYHAGIIKYCTIGDDVSKKSKLFWYLQIYILYALVRFHVHVTYHSNCYKPILILQNVFLFDMFSNCTSIRYSDKWPKDGNDTIYNVYLHGYFFQLMCNLCVINK